MTSFDRIAPHYDFLARLVFGKSITQSQEYYLKEIKEGDRILILGGGTGWILDSIYAITKPGEIWYVDSSMKMIERSKSRIIDSRNVHFIQGTAKDIPLDFKFDIIITNFFLDVFNEEELPELINTIVNCALPKSVWLCSDFVDIGKWYHKALLNFMYLFFHVSANLKNNKLPSWETSLQKNGVAMTSEKIFWNGFIKSAVFSVG